MKRSVAERYCNDFANFEDTLRDAKVKGRPSQVIGVRRLWFFSMSCMMYTIPTQHRQNTSSC